MVLPRITIAIIHESNYEFLNGGGSGERVAQIPGDSEKSTYFCFNAVQETQKAIYFQNWNLYATEKH